MRKAKKVNRRGKKSRPNRKWIPEKVIQSIRARLRQGRSLGSVVMYQEDLALYAAGQRFFGTWVNALRAAGLKPYQHLGKNKWTIQDVVSQALEWIKQHPKRPRDGTPLRNRWIFTRMLVRKYSPEAKRLLAKQGIRWPPYPQGRKKGT